jgi:hypothetical protein
MLHDMTEVVGPVALEFLVAAACLVVFGPLVAALIAPIFN